MIAIAVDNGTPVDEGSPSGRLRMAEWFSVRTCCSRSRYEVLIGVLRRVDAKSFHF